MTDTRFLEIVRLVDQLNAEERQALLAYLRATNSFGEVDKITNGKPAQKGDFRMARGVFDWAEGNEPAEVTIRRLRDDS